MTRWQVARRLLRLLRPLAPLMAVSSAARVGTQGLGVAIPGLAAALVVGAWSGVGGLVALLALLALLKGALRYVEQFTGHSVAFSLLAGLRSDTYRWVEPLAPAGLEDRHTGDLVSRVVGDIDRVEPFYAHTIAPLISAVTVPLLTVLGLWLWVDPVVAAIFAPFPMLIALAVPLLRAGRVAALAAQARKLTGTTAAVFTDAVQGVREIAVFRAKETVSDRVEEISARSTRVRTALAAIASPRVMLGDLLAGGAVLAVTAVAASRLEAGAIGLAGLAAAMVVAWVGTAPARALEEIVPDLEQALAAAERLFDLDGRQPVVEDTTGPPLRPKDGSVAFHRVSVEPVTDRPAALDNVDVEIPDRGYVAVVGPSGAGKTTLVELLARFRDPDEGLVALGGTDIRRMEISDLRARVALVPQRPDIFYGTVASNLRLAKPGAGENELWEALDRAALGPWASTLPNGLDTLVGELGDTLSGGERQRLALARAFLRDPDILVLDEATSELDSSTERIVLDQIAQERGKRTIIVVAHRIDTVTNADQVLVLDRGRLVERGRHQELIERGGVYAGLWQRQEDLLPP